MNDQVIDGNGFHVELVALDDAARGIEHSVESAGSFDLRDLCGPGNLYGHDGLHAALRGMCDRWGVGLDLLTVDASRIAEMLAQAARAYREADEDIANSMTVDPAVGIIAGGCGRSPIVGPPGCRARL